uniref:Uncharacterized protein n=1 Tax=Arundo donax TaxID=35708 RepID=A0A0A9B6L9_ARUDO
MNLRTIKSNSFMLTIKYLVTTVKYNGHLRVLRFVLSFRWFPEGFRSFS